MQPGDRFGRYRIESLLGRGGMGEVFRAWDEILQRRVAIKVLTLAQTAPGSEAGTPPVGSASRVLHEARMVAALRHPNVVAIFDVGEQDGAPYIVMEYLRGFSLRALISRAGVTPDDRVRWLSAIASALGAAHKQGLVHRDVKPDNVLVDIDGVVKVLDFGVARRESGFDAAGVAVPTRAAGAGGHTEEGSLIGTPAYMAPEQIRKEPLDGRADQFAWGVTAYELFTGALPWPATKVKQSMLETVLWHEPERLDPIALGVSPEVTNAVHRALSKRREERFPSMDPLLDALGHKREPSANLTMPVQTSIRIDGADTSIESAPTALAHLTTTGSKLPVSNTHALPAPRKRARVALVAGVSMLALVGGAIGVRRYLHARAMRSASAPSTNASAGASASSGTTTTPYATIHPKNVRRLTMQPGCQEFASITPDGREVLYDGPDGRDVHLYAVDVQSGVSRVLTEGTGWQWAPSVSPDGREVAYLRTENDKTSAFTLALGTKETHDPRASKPLIEGSVRPHYAPDGRAIWGGQGSAPSRVDRETRKATRAVTPPAGYRAVGVTEVPDGRALVHLAQVEGHDSGGIVMFGATSRAGDAPTWLTHDGVDEALFVMPDFRSVIAPRVGGALRGHLARFPIDRPIDRSDGGGIEVLAIPDVLPTKGFSSTHGRAEGDRFVWSTCTERSDLTVLSPRVGAPSKPTSSTSTTTSLLGESEWTDESPAWIPGTNKLLVASDRAQTRGLWLLDADNREPPRALSLGGVKALAPSVSRDGAWVAFVSPADGLFVAPIGGSDGSDGSDGHVAARRLTHGEADGSPCFSADGGVVYFQSTVGGRLRVSSIRLDTLEIKLVRDNAARPTAGTNDGELAFLATEKDIVEGTPMFLDLKSGAVRAMASTLGNARFTQVRVSPDGKRAALLSPSLTEVQEIELASGKTRQHYVAGVDEVKELAYFGEKLLVARQVWSGGLWVAEEAR